MVGAIATNIGAALLDAFSVALLIPFLNTLFDRPGVKNPKGDQQSAGGMMKSPPGVPYSFWLPYVGVDNAGKISERATRLGAKVTVGPMDIPNVGRFACWMDPQGASIAILQPKM